MLLQVTIDSGGCLEATANEVSTQRFLDYSAEVFAVLMFEPEFSIYGEGVVRKRPTAPSQFCVSWSGWGTAA